jgi:hypothetical protein
MAGEISFHDGPKNTLRSIPFDGLGIEHWHRSFLISFSILAARQSI